MGTGISHLVNSLSKWFGRFRRRSRHHGVFARVPLNTAQLCAGATLLQAGADILADQILGHEPKGTGAIVDTQLLPMRLKAELITIVDYSDDTALAQTTVQSFIEPTIDPSGLEIER